MLSAELRTWGWMAAKASVPTGVVNWLRDARNKRRSSSRGKQPVALSFEELVACFEKLGVRRGADLFVHSSIRSIGPITGGAETVVRALRAVLGDNATILMPTYPVIGGASAWLSSPEPFDTRSAPSTMGALSEYFRRLPGARRSAHPTHSVACLGPHAADYVKEHHLHADPCAVGSPFEFLLRNGGDILCIGSGIGKVTAYHVVESLEGDRFPISFHLGEKATKRVILDDGQMAEAPVQRGGGYIAAWRIDNFPPVRQRFEELLTDADALRRQTLGKGECHLLDGNRFLAAVTHLSRRGVTIYHRPFLHLAPGRLTPDFRR